MISASVAPRARAFVTYAAVGLASRARLSRADGLRAATATLVPPPRRDPGPPTTSGPDESGGLQLAVCPCDCADCQAQVAGELT